MCSCLSLCMEWYGIFLNEFLLYLFNVGTEIKLNILVLIRTRTWHSITNFFLPFIQLCTCAPGVPTSLRRFLSLDLADHNPATMDPESFLDIANQVTKLKMYPYFDVAHYIISCLYMREDLAVGKY